VQLGELQRNLSRFTNRKASVVALSVDPPAHSRNMIRRMELAFPVVSDTAQRVMAEFGVINPETEELALHAVYIVDRDRRVFYRKVARRRPLSQELLDAIDYYRGEYPLGDEGPEYRAVPVAYPHNEFQALLEIATNSALPATIDPGPLQEIIALRRSGKSDESTIRYRRFIAGQAPGHNEKELLATAAWITKRTLGLDNEAISTGRALNAALVRQRELREADATAGLGEVQAELDRLRSRVREQSGPWRLRAAKTTLRTFRELSLAALREHQQ